MLGEGPANLVYVPTFLGAVEHYWEYRPIANFFRRLAECGRMVMFDRRGSGMSDHPVEPKYSLEDQIDDVLAVMDAAGMERAALFAQLEGCAMATLFAGTYPDRVTSLALYSPFPRATRAPDYPFGLSTEERIAGVVDPSIAVWGEGSRGIPISPSLADDPGYVEWFGKLERLTAAPGHARRLFMLHNDTDVRAILPQVRVPTLVLSRPGTGFYEGGHARYVAERIPGARLVELPGSDIFVASGDVDPLVNELEEFFTGTRRERPPERVLATVMFTDIVASTERAAELGDARWRQLLDRHNELVRRHLARHQGREVKTIGDGFLATFDGPARGVRCAAEIAGEVRRLGIEIRAGLHTGECELVGDDVAGMAVNIGARVSALAGPGEVLVSGTVKDLVVGSGLEFADRGEHELKGVPGSWRLYEAAGAAAA
ncbi:MAG: adenylate/guanylate cyclase domain-containing protein [Actinomycetota bacterium]|nr:adenylate/guanylate cyclase domain-containing protein [Actinomycetota bacterium]